MFRAFIALFAVPYLAHAHVTSNLTSFEKMFHDSGLAVLNSDSGRIQHQTLVETLFQGGDTIEIPGEIWDAFSSSDMHFSPYLGRALSRLQFPPGVVLVFIAKDSVDVEACLEGRQLPCESRGYRFLQLESHDTMVLDPSRVRVRFCNIAETSLGCVPARTSVGNLRLMRSARFSPQNQEPKLIVDAIASEDYSKLFDAARIYKIQSTL